MAEAKAKQIIMETIKGIIFDFNGTLLWDSQYHSNAWNIFLVKYGFFLSEEEIHENMHGRTNGEIFSYIFKRDIRPDELSTLSHQKEGIYRGLIMRDDLHLASGVTEMFNYCESAAIPMAIATSSDKENADFYYERYNLNKWFPKRRYIYNDYTFKGKPAPDIFQKAAETMFLKPSEIMIFEDSPAGIEAAEKFGAGKVVIVNSTKANYSAYSHDVIRSFDDAMPIIENIIDKPRDIYRTC